MLLDSKFHGLWKRAYSPTLPPDSQIREFLHLLRPLILDDEATHFPRILNIIARHFQHPYFRHTIKNLRDGFLKGSTIQYFNVSIDELHIIQKRHFDYGSTPLNIIEILEKEAQLRSFNKRVPFALSKSLFINQLRDKVQGRCNVASSVY